MSESRKDDVQLIPKHQAELHDMHLVHVNSNMKTLCIIVAVVFAVAMIATSFAVVRRSEVFVYNYTSRAEKWLETMLRMQNGNAATEVLNEEVSPGNVQQLPVP